MYNKFIVAGNLGRAPEMRFTKNSKPVTTFPLAVNDPFKKDANPLWIRVTVWGKQAEWCNEWLDKGRTVLVEGRITYDQDTGNPRVYEHNGVWKSSLEMTADSVVFMSAPKERELTDRGAGYDVEDEDPPF